MDSQARESFRPPTMAFATFWNFIEELSTRPLPPGIDRSMMNSKSGTDQRNLISALSGFGLIGPKNQVEQPLQSLVTTDKELRNAELEKLIRQYYPDAVRVSEANDTEQQLSELFRTKFNLETKDTRRKAITFFLHAASTAGIHLSPHFPSTRSGSGGPGAPRAKRPRARKAPVVPASEASTASAGTNYSTEVQVGIAGSVVLTVNVNPLELSGDDRAFFFGLVDRMNEYRARGGQTSSPSDGGASKEDSEGGAL